MASQQLDILLGALATKIEGIKDDPVALHGFVDELREETRDEQFMGSGLLDPLLGGLATKIEEFKYNPVALQDLADRLRVEPDELYP